MRGRRAYGEVPVGGGATSSNHINEEEEGSAYWKEEKREEDCDCVTDYCEQVILWVI